MPELMTILHQNFNPRAPRGARLCRAPAAPYSIPISIHAPREGRDCRLTPYRSCIAMISIHAPREGRDSIRSVLPCILPAFQSTRPARGATVANAGNWIITDISIHAPREGRD